MREYSEYKPALSETAAFGFNVARSLKSNPLSWIGFAVISVAFVAVAAVWPAHKAKLAAADILAAEQPVMQAKAALHDRIEKTRAVLTALDVDQHLIDRQLKSPQATYDAIQLPNGSDIIGYFNQVKRLPVTDKKARLYQDDFIVLQSAASAIRSNTKEAEQQINRLNGYMDQALEFYGKAQALADQHKGDEAAQKQVTNYVSNNLRSIYPVSVNLPDFNPSDKGYSNDIYWMVQPDKPAAKPKKSGLSDLIGLLN